MALLWSIEINLFGHFQTRKTGGQHSNDTSPYEVSELQSKDFKVWGSNREGERRIFYKKVSTNLKRFKTIESIFLNDSTDFRLLTQFEDLQSTRAMKQTNK